MATSQLPSTGGKHRRRQRRTGALVAAVAMVTAIAVGATIFVGSRGTDRDPEPPAQAERASEDRTPDRPSPTEGGTAGSSPSSAPSPVELDASLSATDAAPMEAVEVTGRVANAAEGTRVQVEMLHPDGRWIAFPLRPVVDGSGSFRTYVEVGRSGLHELRVVEPESGLTSETMSLSIG